MKIARFRVDECVYYGLAEEERLTVISGDIFGKFEKTDQSFPLDGVVLLPPVVPSKIVCVGLNYREHIKEINSPFPTQPSVFLKPPTCLIGPGDPIVVPRNATRVDYEGEMAVVIKNTCKDVSEKDALDQVLGYSCFNDVTERDLVMASISNLAISKGFDTFGPFGPWISTDVDPFHATVRTYLNDELKQEGNTGDCVFSIPYLIQYVSWCMTLHPGDVLITGTPHGVSPMKTGDVVTVEVEGVGRLSNPIR